MTRLECAMRQLSRLPLKPSLRCLPRLKPLLCCLASRLKPCRNLPPGLTPRAAQKYQQLLLPAVGRAYCPPTAASPAKQVFEMASTRNPFLASTKRKMGKLRRVTPVIKCHLIISLAVSAINQISKNNELPGKVSKLSVRSYR